MVSATGLWDQNKSDYDPETLAALPIRRDQLADPASLDQSENELLPEYRALWPEFAQGPLVSRSGRWSLQQPRQRVRLNGSCLAHGGHHRRDAPGWTPDSDAPQHRCLHKGVPPGLWRYRVDKTRFVTGGALSNGGDVYAWMKRKLALPKDIEARLEDRRSRNPRPDDAAFLLGRTHALLARRSARLDHRPFRLHRRLRHSARGARIGRSALSRNLLLAGRALGSPTEVIASGGALLHSPAWTQMMADALGRPVTHLHRNRSFLPRRGSVGAGAARHHRRPRCAAGVDRRGVHAASRVRGRLSGSACPTKPTL